MSAEPKLRPIPVESGLAEALYFAAEGHQLFGWLHRPTVASSGRLGLVICKPFGYESVCAHRGVRAFAEAAAGSGVPTLRFDFLGTGDSPDIDPLANQIEAWTRDTVAAVRVLERLTGVTSICLVGLRLGALIALLAARQCDAVTGLALVAPVTSGRRYLREIRTTRLAAALGIHARDVEVPPANGSMEVSGFPVSAASIAALEDIDFTGPTEVPSVRMLVIDGASMPVARRWAQALPARGIETTYHALPGMVEMLMTAPQFAQPATTMIAATCEWLTQLSGRTDSHRGARGGPHHSFGNEVAVEKATLSIAGSNPATTLTEHPVFIPAEAMLFGIVTQPGPDEKRRRAVILLNAGADHHIGASRLYVSLARRWAARGYFVLRLDLAGLGDSATRPGCAPNEVFPPGALADIGSAIEYMRVQYGVRDITLAGLCSGAYHALRAAVAALPVHRILLVNPQNYFWKEGMTLNDLQLVEVVHNPGVYRQRIFSLAAWWRVIRGDVNIGRIVTIYLKRPLLAAESLLREGARWLRVPLAEDLGRELEEVIARGVRVAFVFARGEPGIELLKLQAGSAVRRLGERYRMRILDHGDHVFTQSGPREVMEEVLSEELFARDDWPGTR
jgi:alpha-beta hydrolase superfamily lysophospholipase